MRRLDSDWRTIHWSLWSLIAQVSKGVTWVNYSYMVAEPLGSSSSQLTVRLNDDYFTDKWKKIVKGALRLRSIGRLWAHLGGWLREVKNRGRDGGDSTNVRSHAPRAENANAGSHRADASPGEGIEYDDSAHDPKEPDRFDRHKRDRKARVADHEDSGRSFIVPNVETEIHELDLRSEAASWTDLGDPGD